MKKVVLDPNTLRVETFRTRKPAEGPRGTVRAHATNDVECTPTGILYESCQVSCMYMCFPTLEYDTCHC